MTLDQFKTKIETKVTDILESKLPDWFAMIVTQDIIAAVESRIRKTGILSSGKKPSYSTEETFIGYNYGKPLENGNYNKLYKTVYEKLKRADKKSKKKAKKTLTAATYSSLDSNWVTIDGHSLIKVEGGYKQIREMGGYQTNHVDLTISNTMLRSVKVKSKTLDSSKLTVVYGPTGEEEEKKVEGHNKRYGENILLPNAEEILAMKNRVEKQLIKYLNAGLFGK